MSADDKISFEQNKKPDGVKTFGMSYRPTKDGILLNNGFSTILIPTHQMDSMYKDMCKEQGKEVIVRPKEANLHAWKAR